MKLNPALSRAMTRTPSPIETVYGHRCATPRLTRLGAALIALGLALPGGVLVWLVSLFF